MSCWLQAGGSHCWDGPSVPEGGRIWNRRAFPVKYEDAVYVCTYVCYVRIWLYIMYVYIRMPYFLSLFGKFPSERHGVGGRVIDV